MALPEHLRNRVRTPLAQSKLLTASAASVLMLMAAAPAAQAQVVNITTCAELNAGDADNPGTMDGGATINVDLAAVTPNCVISGQDHIELEDGEQDDVTINILAGTRLTNTDANREQTVIFIDNSENRTTINVAAGATLSGENGVIYVEGDESAIVNAGDIIGTGEQEEGTIYFDRDTDRDLNFLANLATGRILAQDNGPAIGIEVLLADGFDDPPDVGAQNLIADFPTFRIVNQAGGLIQSTGTASDDNDAINIAGAPGTTGNIARTCVEGTAVNCIVNLTLVNHGTIRSIFNNSGVAGITIEDDAVFHGAITNQAGGLITGTRNGIRIGDVQDNGVAPEHDGTINNRGTISGTGASSRGIDLEGDGITIRNSAIGTISGLSIGIEVGAGTSNNGTEVHSGENNRIINRGTISGGNQAIDSRDATGAIRINNFGGGVLDGDVRGSLANTDLLFFRNGASTLTHDVLQDFDVRVTANASLTFDGSRTIEGRLQSGGDLIFDLGDTQTVTGNVRLLPGSTVEITDTGAIASLGQQFTLIDVGGTLFNFATLDDSQAASDNSFLLDFDFVDSNDLIVEAVAAGSGTPNAKVSDFTSAINFSDATTEAFGTTVLQAFVDGGLNGTTAFSGLGSLGTASAVGGALEGLTPDVGFVRNVFNTVESNGQIIDQRLNNLNCTQYDGEQSCFANAESGAWFEKSYPFSSQSNLDLSSTSREFGTRSGAESVTLAYGYDKAVNDTTVVGLSGSYTEIEIDADRSSIASTELEVAQISAYAGHQKGQANFAAKASYTTGNADARRQSFETIESDVNIEGLNLQGAASYNVDLGHGFYAKPQVDVEYTNLSTSAFAETGGLNLNIDGTNTNVIEGRAGLTLGARKAISDTQRADVYVTGALRNDFYGQRDEIGFAFAGQSGTLGVTNPSEFAVQGLAGINIISGENFSFGGAVNGELSDEFNSVGGSVKTKFKF